MALAAAKNATVKGQIAMPISKSAAAFDSSFSLVEKLRRQNDASFTNPADQYVMSVAQAQEEP